LGFAVAWKSVAFAGTWQSHLTAAPQVRSPAGQALGTESRTVAAPSSRMAARPAAAAWAPLGCIVLLAASMASRRRTPRSSHGKRSSCRCQVVTCHSVTPDMQKEEALERTFDLALAPEVIVPEVSAPRDVRPPPAVQPGVWLQPSAVLQQAAAVRAPPMPYATPQGSRAAMVGGARRASSRRAHRSRTRATSAGTASADRRRIGARLQPTVDAPVIEAPFDPSRVRTKLQAGALSIRLCRCAERPREFKTPSASHSLNVQSGVHGEKHRESKDL